jgi:hypothetical protein
VASFCKHRLLSGTWCNTLNQRGKTGGPLAISGPRPLVTGPEKLLVYLILVATNSSISFTPEDLGKKL